jgi:hypothetical protein
VRRTRVVGTRRRPGRARPPGNTSLGRSCHATSWPRPISSRSAARTPQSPVSDPVTRPARLSTSRLTRIASSSRSPRLTVRVTSPTPRLSLRSGFARGCRTVVESPLPGCPSWRNGSGQPRHGETHGQHDRTSTRQPRPRVRAHTRTRDALPVGWDPYFKDVMTVADIYDYPTQHYDRSVRGRGLTRVRAFRRASRPRRGPPGGAVTFEAVPTAGALCNRRRIRSHGRNKRREKMARGTRRCDHQLGGSAGPRRLLRHRDDRRAATRAR